MNLKIVLAIIVLIVGHASSLLVFDHTHFNGLEEEASLECTMLNKFLNRLYFSVTTFSTVGYGDISPRTKEARVVGMIFMSLLITMPFLVSYLDNKKESSKVI